LAKESNLYAKRALLKGRKSRKVYLLLGGAFMNALERLAVIRHKSKINKDWQHNDLFRLLRKNDIWVTAYENIKRNKRILPPLMTKEIVVGMSIPRLAKLQSKVLNESYQFMKINKLQILKSNRQKRQLSLLTFDDKIVQEVIRIILEAVYAPYLSQQSFVFPNELGPHDALEYIEAKFCSVDWIIKGNLDCEYSIINCKQFYNLFSKKIYDNRFINLICKLLKSEILNQRQLTKPYFRTGIISLILTTIYFNELDEWVDDKRNMFYSFRMKEYNRKFIKVLNTLNLKKIGVPGSVTRQITYIRYAKHWMIGIRGHYILAKTLHTSVNNFLVLNLKQTLHTKKPKIIDLHLDKAKFLGYQIYLPNTQDYIFYTSGSNHKINRMKPNLRFDIPVDLVLQKMEEQSYIKKLVKGHRSISKTYYITFDDSVIIKHFSQVWETLANYYTGCTNLSKLQYLHSLLHISCAMTLSHKHCSSIKKVFAKYGKSLKIFNDKTGISFFPRNKWSIKKRGWQNKQKFANFFKFMQIDFLAK